MAQITEGTYRVLVVEDEPAISEAISYALEREGMSVEAAYTVSEALSRVRRRPPSLVLLDMMLPGARAWMSAGRSGLFPMFPSLC